MLIADFVQRVAEHPALELMYRDTTICIVRCGRSAGSRRVRLGLWAIRRLYWEQLAEAMHVKA